MWRRNLERLTASVVVTIGALSLEGASSLGKAGKRRLRADDMGKEKIRKEEDEGLLARNPFFYTYINKEVNRHSWWTDKRRRDEVARVAYVSLDV